MTGFRQELFGPVATLTTARDADHALALANDSEFGLSATVYTTDEAQAQRFARELECGGVFINGYCASDARVAFGGVKKSGFGRELSHFGAARVLQCADRLERPSLICVAPDDRRLDALLAHQISTVGKEPRVATVINNAMLEAILAEIRPLIGRGKVADYIPALASVSGDKLGDQYGGRSALCAGDAHERFSIQSISKVLSLVVAMNHYQEGDLAAGGERSLRPAV
jgi:hypothetical protein